MIGALDIFKRPRQKHLSDEGVSYNLYAIGKKYSEDRKWRKAMKLLNRGLVLQLSSLGEDNEITERTLRLITMCLMNIGKEYVGAHFTVCVPS